MPELVEAAVLQGLHKKQNQRQIKLLHYYFCMGFAIDEHLSVQWEATEQFHLEMLLSRLLSLSPWWLLNFEAMCGRQVATQRRRHSYSASYPCHMESECEIAFSLRMNPKHEPDRSRALPELSSVVPFASESDSD